MKKKKKKSNRKKRSSVNDSKMKAVCFVKFLSLMLPLIAYVTITVLFPPPKSGFICLGIIGSFIFGLGLVNIAGYLDDSYLGIEITGITLGLGGSMIGISAVVMYIPAIYTKIDDHQVTFYFLIWAFISISMLYYLLFRGAMKRYMRGQGVSKSRITALMKGAGNFWLYKAANDSLNLRWMYHINRLFVFFSLVCGTLHLLFGWSKVFSPIIAVVTIITLAFNLPMWTLVISTWNQGSSKKRGGDSPNLYVGYLLPVGAIAAVVMFTFT